MVGALMLTGVGPLVDAFRGSLGNPRNLAWFLHPILCVAVSGAPAFPGRECRFPEPMMRCMACGAVIDVATHHQKVNNC
jgi:hypothetical protein